ncbi:MAG: hypothetical protein AAFY71_26195 [Bacteroidota bacterium]
MEPIFSAFREDPPSRPVGDEFPIIDPRNVEKRVDKESEEKYDEEEEADEGGACESMFDFLDAVFGC